MTTTINRIAQGKRDTKPPLWTDDDIPDFSDCRPDEPEENENRLSKRTVAVLYPPTFSTCTISTRMKDASFDTRARVIDMFTPRHRDDTERILINQLPEDDYEALIEKATGNLITVESERALNPNRPFLVFNPKCWATDFKRHRDYRCNSPQCSHPDCGKKYIWMIIRRLCSIVGVSTPGHIGALKFTDREMSHAEEMRLQESGIMHFTFQKDASFARLNRDIRKLMMRIEFHGLYFVQEFGECGYTPIHFHCIGTARMSDTMRDILKAAGWNITVTVIRDSHHLRKAVRYSVRNAITHHAGKTRHAYRSIK